MQTIWKGAISFGLVSIPVKLYSATEERGVPLHQVHAADGGRVRYKRFCEVDGEEVAYREIAKGYDLPDGDTVVLTDEDLASLPLSSSRTVDVLAFVPAEQIDPVATGRSYYLQADGTGEKPYVLLRDALERAGKVALVKVALRSRESLATLRAREGVLLLQTMLWPDEIRDGAGLAPGAGVTVRPQEVDMAESYIETLTGDFDPSQYTDGYRNALEELVEAKAAGRATKPEPDRRQTGGAVVDLMEALRASVEAAKASRGGGRASSAAASSPAARAAADVASSESAPGRRSAKKAAASKSPGKKAAAQTPSGSASTRKTAAKTTKKPAARKSADTSSGRTRKSA